MADQPAKAQKGNGAQNQNANQRLGTRSQNAIHRAGPSILTAATSPSPRGIPESKPTVTGSTNIGQLKGPGNPFPKLAESRNLADKLGVPLNTSKLSASKMPKQHQEVISTSYKDALLSVAAAASDASPSSSADYDILQMLLASLRTEESPQDRPIGDLEMSDQVLSTKEMVQTERKLQRSQRKKVIHSVALVHSEPKAGPSAPTPKKVVASSDIEENELKKESSDCGIRKTAYRKRKDKR